MREREIESERESTVKKIEKRFVCFVLYHRDRKENISVSKREEEKSKEIGTFIFACVDSFILKCLLFTHTHKDWPRLTIRRRNFKRRKEKENFLR